uniref:Uncharacterized protein n=1 Tax=Amphora coffeiformis TaxID=265554 RepID=A0A7S3L3X9_9STRA
MFPRIIPRSFLSCAWIVLLCLCCLSGYRTTRRPATEFGSSIVAVWYDEPVRLGGGASHNDGKDDDTASEEIIWHTEPWIDMNLRRPVLCGAHKCFVRSLRNDSDVGYIIGSASRYEKLIQAAKLADKVESELGIHHLYELPAEASTWYIPNVSKSAVVDRINALVRQPLRKVNEQLDKSPVIKLENCSSTETTEENPSIGCIAVQRVRRAPEPKLFCATTAENFNLTLHEAIEFRKRIQNKTKFSTMFDDQRYRIYELWKAYPKLVLDFQGFVDVQGRMHLIDMDLDVKKVPGRKSLQNARHRGYEKLKVIQQVLVGDEHDAEKVFLKSALHRND